MKFVSLLLVIVVSGRMMLSDPNIVYRYVGTITFVMFNFRAIMIALYIQYRNRNGWTSVIDIPEENH